MGDVGELWNSVKDAKRAYKKEWGIDCPGCIDRHPKRIPTRMTPGGTCKVCRYQDHREGPTLMEFWQDHEPVPT